MLPEIESSNLSGPAINTSLELDSNWAIGPGNGVGISATFKVFSSNGTSSLHAHDRQDSVLIAAPYLKYGGLLNDLQLPNMFTKSESLVEIS